MPAYASCYFFDASQYSWFVSTAGMRASPFCSLANLCNLWCYVFAGLFMHRVFTSEHCRSWFSSPDNEVLYLHSTKRRVETSRTRSYDSATGVSRHLNYSDCLDTVIVCHNHFEHSVGNAYHSGDTAAAHSGKDCLQRNTLNH